MRKLSALGNVKLDYLPRPVLRTFERKINPNNHSPPRRSFSVSGGPRAAAAETSSSSNSVASASARPSEALVAAVDWKRLPKKITDALLPFQREGVAYAFALNFFPKSAYVCIMYVCLHHSKRFSLLT